MGTLQQRSTDQAFVTAASSVYAVEVRKAINSQQDQLNQLEAAHEQLQQTLTSLEQLPSKLKHEIMVPMGKHAFFPGHLTRTNEITVHLGDQYYVEVTAGHARGILERKQAAVADGISKAQQQLQALQARLDLSADAISGVEEDPDAREIRSSLAESDALLASARKAKAAAAGMQQESIQQPQRVTTATGYSYTRPQGPSTAQQSAQDHAEDIALQEKLQLLLLMEQQQELQDVLHDTPAQQQADIHAGIPTIQEGVEGGEDSEPEDTTSGSDGDESSSSQQGSAGGLGNAAAADAAAGAAAAGDATAAGRLSAVHRLQQLEAQSDSDDDEQQQQQQPPMQSQQQRPQQQQPAKPLKSALKKGFLGPPAPAGSNSSRDANAAGSSSSRGAQARGSSVQAAIPSKPQPTAFIGNIVERPTPTASAAGATAGPAAAAADANVVGGNVERPAQAAGAAAGAPGSSGSKPMSKFKLRRMGLDPDAE